MPGIADYDPAPAPLVSDVVPVFCARIPVPDPDADPDAIPDPDAPAARPSPLPNVRCTSIRYAHNADSGQAQFRYVLDTPGGPFNPDGDFPTQPEQVFGLDSPGGPNVVAPDDRIGVFGVTQAGDIRLLFDGFVQLPSAKITGGSQRVSFGAMGTPIRCWDRPLWAAYCRSSQDPTIKADDREAAAIKVRFNPDGRANATASGADGKTGKYDHPCFLDPEVCEDRKIGRHWTVAMAARYILARGNTKEEWVKNPLLAALDVLLDSREPKEDSFYDPDDPDTYDSKPIVLRDLDVTGDAWPVALEKVLAPHGFLFAFRRRLTDDFLPEWKLSVYRRAAEPLDDTKSVQLQPYGEDTDPGRSNVESVAITRNLTDAVNSVVVETAPSRWEASFVLAPGFTPSAADCASPAALKHFHSEESPDFPANSDKYRLYVLDEAGDGHYDFASSTFVTGDAASLKAVLGGEKEEESAYVKRRRPPRRSLLTRDGAAPAPGVADDEDEEGEGPDGEGGEGEVDDAPKGRPRRAVLCLSTDYAGETPGVWDGTGTWFKVSSNWTLLDDRVGIRIDVANPEAWAVGNKAVSFGKAVTSSGGTVKGVSAQAKAGETRFTLMLTCVIEGDSLVVAAAGKRAASPGRYEVRRYVDARERYRFDRIAPNSWYNKDPGAVAIRARDDTKAALAESVARRAAGEMPRVGGTVTIPRLVNSYRVGDRIREIEGRGIGLRTNLGSGQGEGDQFPIVAGLEYDLDDRQATILHLEDSRAALDDEYSEGRTS